MRFKTAITITAGTVTAAAGKIWRNKIGNILLKEIDKNMKFKTCLLNLYKKIANF